MNIFSEKVYRIEDVDLTKWETINGDYIILEKARPEYLSRCLEVLNDYMQRYSSHINYPVWEAYTTVIEDILCSKE